MNDLSLDFINAKSPYLVKRADDGDYVFQTGRVTGEMPRRALHLVFEWLDQHKDELMLNWKRMENGETLVKINPLD